MNPTNPKEFRYIKLGHGGSWTQPAFERGELHFGYRTLPHDLCLQGEVFKDQIPALAASSSPSSKPCQKHPHPSA